MSLLVRAAYCCLVGASFVTLANRFSIATATLICAWLFVGVLAIESYAFLKVWIPRLLKPHAVVLMDGKKFYIPYKVEQVLSNTRTTYIGADTKIIVKGRQWAAYLNSASSFHGPIETSLDDVIGDFPAKLFLRGLEFDCRMKVSKERCECGIWPPCWKGTQYNVRFQALDVNEFWFVGLTMILFDNRNDGRKKDDTRKNRDRSTLNPMLFPV
jgi:hypothetical protein